MGRALAPIDRLWPPTSNPWKRKARTKDKGCLESADTRRRCLARSSRSHKRGKRHFRFWRTTTIKDVSFQLRPGTALPLSVLAVAANPLYANCFWASGLRLTARYALTARNSRHGIRKSWGLFGYLPQDVDLLRAQLPKTSQEWSRCDPEKVVKAAQLAGVHELILKLLTAATYPHRRLAGQGLNGSDKDKELALHRALKRRSLRRMPLERTRIQIWMRKRENRRMMHGHEAPEACRKNNRSCEAQSAILSLRVVDEIAWSVQEAGREQSPCMAPRATRQCKNGGSEAKPRHLPPAGRRIPKTVKSCKG